MRVMLLVIAYPPVLNSAARLFSELAESLAERGHQVTVMTTYPDRYLAGASRIPTWERNGVEVFRLKSVSLPKRVPLLRGLEQFVFAFQYYMRGRRLERYDVVIAYCSPLPFGMTATLLAKKWKGISIINVQDLYPQTAVDLGLMKSRPLIRFSEWLEQWVYERPDGIVVHSDGNRDYVVAKGSAPEKTWTIHNWIDLAKYSPGPKNNEIRQKFGGNSRFIVSYAGVMGFAQGVGDVLNAAEIVSEKAPEIVFLLAGEGVMVASLKELAARKNLENVHFLPHLNEREYIDLLRASDVSLVTLHKDLKTPVVPGKLPCILGVERPAICSTSPASDAKKIVEEEDCGLWVPAGSPRALSDAILSLHAAPGRAEKMGINGRKYVEAHYDRNTCIDKYEQVIATLMAS